MKVLFTLISLFISQLLLAQTPVVDWAKCYGGSNSDRAYSAIQTSDGGYLVCGYTNSADGDVTQNKGSSDAWLVKTNPDGSILWQKTYGGTNIDIFRSIIVTGSGYVACGETASDDGDVSANKGMSDFWVVGIGITGNLIWEKTYGGSNNDFAHDIAISDSGYFVVGQTFSEDGDVSSYKDNGDGWLIAIDDTGSLLNEKARGGSAEDIYTDVLPVTSGGFLLGGYSFSNDGNVSGLNHGGSDGWLVKVSKSGNFQWTECYGSTGDDGISEITESTSGNYVMSGWLTNETDQNSWIFTTDINGVQLSGFDQGGTAVEYGGPLFVNPVNRFISVPSTASTVSGDLTCHIGGDDIWVTENKTDGTIAWQLCLGGTLEDRSTSAILTAEQNYVISGYTNSDNEYVDGNHGSYDWWLVKLLPVCATNAAFTFTENGNIITFNNESESSTEWLWSFGDGITSTQKHPIHEYADVGIYEVCLVSSALDCLSDTFCTVIQICGAPAEAAFNYVLDGGAATFTNSSINASTWSWNFGDGDTSAIENPEHTFVNNGNYIVCLTAIDAGCSESVYCDTITVCINETLSQFEFAIDGGDVDFFNTSPSFSDLFWTFGDGETSTEEDPNHFYSESGTYEVCLVVTDACGTDTTCQTIEICVLPFAGFSYFNTDNFTFNFIDESLYTLEWLWLFGDGGSSTEANPVYTYDEGGTYNVCLIAKNECGNDTLCSEVIIECPEFQSGFGFTQSNDTAFFSDQSSATANEWFWYFDDGTFSTQQNPVHIFDEDGTYNVCLIVSDGCTIDTICHKVTVVGVFTGDLTSTLGWDVFPNPVNDIATISFSLTEASFTGIDLYTITGSHILTIMNGQVQAGKHAIAFNRGNIAPGIYLLKLSYREGTLVHKLVLD